MYDKFITAAVRTKIHSPLHTTSISLASRIPFARSMIVQHTQQVVPNVSTPAAVIMHTIAKPAVFRGHCICKRLLPSSYVSIQRQLCGLIEETEKADWHLNAIQRMGCDRVLFDDMQIPPF